MAHKTPIPDLGDDELLSRSTAGDEEAFLTLYRRRLIYIGIARNQIRRHFGRSASYMELDEYSEEELACPAAGILANLTRAETMEAVRQAVGTLPEAYREAVVLCDQSGIRRRPSAWASRLVPCARD